jgi:hypothetical protein
MFWAPYFESKRPKVMPWLFHRDYSVTLAELFILLTCETFNLHTLSLSLMASLSLSALASMIALSKVLILINMAFETQACQFTCHLPDAIQWTFFVALVILDLFVLLGIFPILWNVSSHLRQAYLIY